MVFKKLPKFKPWHLTHKNPEVFCMSQWQRKTKSVKFLIYRFIFAILFVGILTNSLVDYVLKSSTSIGYWFIYLTNCGVLLYAIYTVYAAVLLTFYHFDWMRLEEGNVSYKIMWILSNVTHVIALVISIVYWSVLFEWELYFKGEQILDLIAIIV